MVARHPNAVPLVYMATCLVDGKRYIGVTCKPLFVRKSQHFYDAEHGKKYKFHAAIRKHGREMFRFSVIKRCANYTEVLAEEKRLVALWKPEYNTSGGGRGRGAGYKLSAEQIEKVASQKRGKPAHNKGTKHTPESIAKMKAWFSEHPMTPRLGVKRPGSGLKGAATRRERGTTARPWLGKNRSQETKDKIVATKRDQGGSGRPVICWNIGTVYRSAADAGKSFGVSDHTISSVCRGVQRTLKGFLFSYCSDVL